MENKLSELQARLKVFGMIFRIGSDLFRAPDFETAAGMAVNNPVSLLKFKRATLLEKADGRIRVVAQYGQVAVNPHAEVALRQVALLQPLREPPWLRVLQQRFWLREQPLQQVLQQPC